MIFVELGSGFRPIPIVCVRDTKVGKFLGLGRFVEKVYSLTDALQFGISQFTGHYPLNRLIFQSSFVTPKKQLINRLNNVTLG